MIEQLHQDTTARYMYELLDGSVFVGKFANALQGLKHALTYGRVESVWVDRPTPGGGPNWVRLQGVL
jgi:hypothetical protein